MKKTFSKLGFLYLQIGGIFAVPVQLSYAYAFLYVTWKAGFSGFFSMAMWGKHFSLILAMTYSMLVRILFWLPSLVSWTLSSDDYSFWKWLAPGIFVESVYEGGDNKPPPASSPESLPEKWSRDEIQNAENFHLSMKANKLAIRMSNAGGAGLVSEEEETKLIELNLMALEHAAKVSDGVLAKAHPDLPSHYRNEYQRSLELFIEAYAEENNAKSIQYSILHDQWVDWFNANKKDIRLPRR